MDYYNMNTVLVTGGCGFIGSHFIDRLFQTGRDIKVLNIDKLTYASSDYINKKYKTSENYIFFKIDLSDYSQLLHVIKDHKIDLVVNFAAESHVDNSINNPNDFIQSNIFGTYNLLRAIIEIYGEHPKTIFHHISTDEVYGDLGLGDPSFEESSNYLPNSPYASTKACSDLILRAWHQTYKLPFILTNCSNNFGPRQHPEKLIPKIISNALRGIQIPIYGNGMNIRDWIFVEDHIEAIFSIYDSKIFNDRFNIGGGFEITNLDLCNLIIDILTKISGKKFPKNIINFVEDRKGHDFRYSINNKKLNLKTGWKPHSDFNDSLYQTIEWFYANYFKT